MGAEIVEISLTSTRPLCKTLVLFLARTQSVLLDFTGVTVTRRVADRDGAMSELFRNRALIPKENFDLVAFILNFLDKVEWSLHGIRRECLLSFQ